MLYLILWLVVHGITLENNACEYVPIALGFVIDIIVELLTG
jgi:hypothetical protein